MRLKKFVIPCLLTALLLFAVGIGVAREGNNADVQAKMLKPTGTPVRSLLNINLLAHWMFSDGISAHDPITNGNGVFFPRGTYGAGVIYTDGLVWGGFVKDGVAPELRVGGTTYNTGLQRGAITSPGVAEDPDAPDVRLWRIRPDYATADLKRDAAELQEVGLTDISDADVADVRAQYETDWNEWPWQKGAPFYDENGNGVMDAGEKPGLAGADQVIWFVANDLNASQCAQLAGSPPIGLEVQVTLWGYNRTDALGNVVFKRYKLIYKGTSLTPNNAVIDSMFFAVWSDPDLGSSGDDYVGCDTTLNINFVYNAVNNDPNFFQYNLAPPSAGYDFLQGPIVEAPGSKAIFGMKVIDGYKNLGMSAFNYFAAGSAISDPDLKEYSGTEQWYNLMNGLKPRAAKPFEDVNGNPTRFPLNGDPVAGDAEIDGNVLPAGDRRMEMITGPFKLAVGDTQEIVVALVTGMGTDRLSSVSVMKYNDISAQYAYDNFFDLAKAPVAPKVRVTNLENKVILNWGWDHENVAKTEQDQKGYNFEGYSVYQLPTAASTKEDAKLIATYDKNNKITKILDYKFDAASGLVLKMPVQLGNDTGIKRSITLTKDAFTGKPLVNGRRYYYVVTAYSYNGDPDVPVHSLESSFNAVTAIPQMEDPGTRYAVEQGDLLEVSHKGTANANIYASVIDPAVLNGHGYKLFFHKQHYYFDKDGLWKKTNYPDSVGKAYKTGDLTGSFLSAVGVYGKPGTVDLFITANVISPDYDYCDGILLTFPPDVTINSASSSVCDYTIDNTAHTVMFGTTDTTGAGPFAGGEVVTVNISSFEPPLEIDYTMYDDGWAVGYGEPYASLGGGIVHVDSSVTVSTIGYKFKSINYWNLADTTDNELILADQSIINGVDLERVRNGVYYAGGENVGVDEVLPVDGVKINVVANYAAPVDFSSITLNGTTTKNIGSYFDNYEIDSYGYNDWAATAKSIDAWGSGTESVDLLQRDYEIRFTGEYDTPITVGGLTYHPIKEGTGSIAVIDGARNYDIADHPDPNNPGTGDPFFIRIPFEVWDMEDPSGPRQVGIIIYDRIQDVSAGGDFYAFNPNNRMYCNFAMIPYDEFIAGDPKELAVSDLLTWNTAWWYTNWTKGDVLLFSYANPIQPGVDEFTYGTAAPTVGDKELAKSDVDMIKVYPNPYYGVNPRETTNVDKFVSFNHLPQKATFYIFNLAGQLVAKLEKDDPSQFFRWNLRNHNDLPVASGLYIIRIVMPEIDKVKVLKLALVQEQQYLEVF